MTIKFISLNMWSGGRLFPQLIDFLRAENADVVALQEVHDSPETTPKERLRSMEVLKRELAYPFQEFAFAFNLSLPEGTFPQGNAVLSKFPIKEHSTVSLFDSVQDEYRDIPEHWPIEPRILQCALLNTPVGEVNVFNVHGV
ncbi:MAG TPA: endonuclease/exonuclease/phosphatase family protein, partial [Candidatus Saccharimonadales bacterium]|nr:endonuclease/exonuclease/phosphatase family protein [Candidatus Saccharimonadales bacterium]